MSVVIEKNIYSIHDHKPNWALVFLSAIFALNLLFYSSKWLWYIVKLLTSSPLFSHFLSLADDPTSYFIEKTKAIRKSSSIFPQPNLQTDLHLIYILSLLSVKTERVPLNPILSCSCRYFFLFHHNFSFYWKSTSTPILLIYHTFQSPVTPPAFWF